MVEDAFSPAEVAEIRAALRVACAEVLAALPSVNWTEMHYQPQLVQTCNLAGGATIDGRSIATQMKSIRLSLGVCPQLNVIFFLSLSVQVAACINCVHVCRSPRVRA